MSLDNLSTNEKTLLKQYIDDGMKVMQEMQDLKDGLKDVTKNLAEQLELKPAVLSKTLRTAYKASLDADRDALTMVEELLMAAGR